MNRLTKITSKWTPIAALAMGLWLGAGCSDDDVAATPATSCNFDDECSAGRSMHHQGWRVRLGFV